MNSNNHGGARRGSGRKSDNEMRDLREVMAQFWTAGAREAALRKMADLAEVGDIGAAKLLMSYAYGTPPSGDEIKVREAVQKELDNHVAMIRARLNSEDAERILSLLFADPPGADAGAHGGQSGAL